MRILIGVFLLLTFGIGCGDSSTEPDDSVAVTLQGEFEVQVERQTQATWTHSVTLPEGTWASARYLHCREFQSTVFRNECVSNQLLLRGNVMEFSGGPVANEYTNRIVVRWEATGHR